MFFKKKSYIGVDIGSFGVKIVELEKNGHNISLKNYGFNEVHIENFAKVDDIGIKQIVENINFVHKKAGMQSREAYAALPAFAVFSSVITLSNIPEKTMDAAVRWEVKKIIPLPIEEMIIDWKKIETTENGVVKILITGAPRSLVNKYIEIFKQAKIQLLGLETETFSMIRSLFLNDTDCNMLVDMGANSTDIIVVNNNTPVLSRSLDVGGYALTRAIQQRLKIDIKQAEQFKYDMGMSDSGGGDLPEVVLDIFKPIFNEIKYVLNLMRDKKEVEVQKIVLTGGSAFVYGVASYIEKITGKKTSIGDPWYRIQYNKDLTKTLDEIAPRMAVAVGLAIREIL